MAAGRGRHGFDPYACTEGAHVGRGACPLSGSIRMAQRPARQFDCALTPAVLIPAAELRWLFSRSSGRSGQK